MLRSPSGLAGLSGLHVWSPEVLNTPGGISPGLASLGMFTTMGTTAIYSLALLHFAVSSSELCVVCSPCFQ